ncbi:rta1 domain protein [Ophiostoma piceae UAMH 11346]|uniref:Rta1 domain protein n=1 Tax=Ophiostoma piceae (strain UAMH 11346) TaxID=1262450 RepID=S3CRU5_OPHP1|nr:rta1 domain protein [Ophiostoma piceae UAMH 11346]
MEDGKYVDGSIFFYAPNKGAPVLFALAFLASGLGHALQCRKHQSWRLTGLYVFCATIFTVGFVLREIAAYNYTNVNLYIASVVLVYAAPPICELANYVVLGRILYYVPHLSPIHPGRVLTTFTAISMLVEVLNANGAAYAANTTLSASQQKTGHALLKASLVLQVVVIVLFLALAAVFHRRTVRAGIASKKLTGALATLYTSEALLLVRTIYRVVEYFSVAGLHYSGDAGVDPQTLSPIIRYEWFFYVFEALLMLANTVLMNMRHPRHYLPKSTKTYLGRDGVSEITGPGYKEERGFVMTLLDPFDVVGLIKGRDKQTAFWEQQQHAGANVDAGAGRKDPEAQ